MRVKLLGSEWAVSYTEDGWECKFLDSDSDIRVRGMTFHSAVESAIGVSRLLNAVCQCSGDVRLIYKGDIAEKEVQLVGPGVSGWVGAKSIDGFGVALSTLYCAVYNRYYLEGPTKGALSFTEWFVSWADGSMSLTHTSTVAEVCRQGGGAVTIGRLKLSLEQNFCDGNVMAEVSYPGSKFHYALVVLDPNDSTADIWHALRHVPFGWAVVAANTPREAYMRDLEIRGCTGLEMEQACIVAANLGWFDET